MLPENDFKRSNVLRMLKGSFDRAGVSTKLIAKGEQESPFEMLIVSHEGIPELPLIGQYFFPEREAAENVCYFSAMVTILEEIAPDKEEEIRKKVEEVNPDLPCGLLAVYPEAGLVYKLTVPLSEDLEEEDLYEEIDILTAHAILLAGEFAGKALKAGDE